MPQASSPPESHFVLNYPVLVLSDGLASAIASSLMMPPDSSVRDQGDTAMEETYELLDKSATLPSEDTESRCDGSESLVSFGDSTIDETSSLAGRTCSEDDSAYDSDESAYAQHLQATSRKPQDLINPDDRCEDAVLTDTQLFNSTLTSRTITQSQVGVDVPASAISPSELYRGSLESEKLRLHLTRPFRLLYHGPTDYKDLIVEKVAQAIAVASNTTSSADSSADKSSRFNIVPISFDDSHVMLIPSTGLELFVTEARGPCSISTTTETCDECPPWGDGPKPDLAVFLHDARLSLTSHDCSIWMEQSGVGTFDLYELTIASPHELAGQKDLAVEKVVSDADVRNQEHFWTMNLEEFLNLDAISLSQEIAGTTGLVVEKTYVVPTLLTFNTVKSQFRSLSHRVIDGYNSITVQSGNICSSLASTSRIACGKIAKQSRDTICELNSYLPTNLQSRLGQAVKTAGTISKPFLMLLLCSMLVHHLLLPWTTFMYQRATLPGRSIEVAPGISPKIIYTSFSGPALPFETSMTVLASSQTAAKASTSESSSSTALPKLSVLKPTTHKRLALQHLLSDDGQRLLRLSPVSLVARKAPQFFLNVTSADKRVNATLKRINATLYEVHLDCFGVKGPIDLLAWTTGTSSLRLNFTIPAEKQQSSFDRLRSLFSFDKNATLWHPVKSFPKVLPNISIAGRVPNITKFAMLKMPRLPELFKESQKSIVAVESKLLSSTSTYGLASKGFWAYGDLALTSMNELTLRVRKGAQNSQQYVVDGTVRALVASEGVLNQVGTRFEYYAAKAKENLPQNPINPPMHKARGRALRLSKRVPTLNSTLSVVLEAPALITAAFRKNSLAMWTTLAEQFHKKSSAKLGSGNPITANSKVGTVGREPTVRELLKKNPKWFGKAKESSEQGVKWLTCRFARAIPRR